MNIVICVITFWLFNASKSIIIVVYYKGLLVFMYSPLPQLAGAEIQRIIKRFIMI